MRIRTFELEGKEQPRSSVITSKWGNLSMIKKANETLLDLINILNKLEYLIIRKLYKSADEFKPGIGSPDHYPYY